ncbi:radical SAM protein [Desulfosudis oleivorans]|uniref:Radical SAM domain protein n=1 Tax=Desulfosudis oleivorans (strain DSM 6200 / JCM 39069 / Hxd3) TaxID=96561 RepID=A9A0M6_DESOH|nr:radical SAM protein [Desulfosudis oleivorans]ABW67526.1 Radical SAM domain protein [Desulfosudis oleivorans Hxd3]
MTTPLPPLDVWYCCDQTLCNFNCPYCAAGLVRSAHKGKMWAGNESAALYKKVIEWIAAQSGFEKGVRLQTFGEPFLCDAFLEGAAWLSHRANIRFVELVTNGSRLLQEYGPFAERAEADRITLWITYHATECDAETILKGALFAQSLGALVIINLLLFPQTLQAVLVMRDRCLEEGLKVHVDLGYLQQNIPIVHERPDIVSRLYQWPDVLAMHLTAAITPFGQACHAGQAFIRILENGYVAPCGPLGQGAGHPVRFGHVLDPDFHLAESLYKTPKACTHRAACRCKEEFLNFAVLQKKYVRQRSMGLVEPRDPGPATNDTDAIVGLGAAGLKLKKALIHHHRLTPPGSGQ